MIINKYTIMKKIDFDKIKDNRNGQQPDTGAAGVDKINGNFDKVNTGFGDMSSIVGLDTYTSFYVGNEFYKGEVVDYNGILYKFIKDHPAGEWNGEDVVEYSLKEDLYDLGKYGQFVANKMYNTFIKELYVLDSSYNKVILLIMNGSIASMTISSDDSSKPNVSSLNRVYEEGKVYELRNNELEIVAYVVFSGKEVNYSGSMNIEVASYSLHNSPTIEAQIINGLDNSVQRKITHDATFNNNVKELYVKTDNKGAAFTVSLFRLNMTGQSYTDALYIQKDGNTFASIEINGLIAGNVYELNIEDGSDDKVYVVFTGYSTENINPSSHGYVLNKDIVFSYSANPTIEAQIINSLVPNESTTKAWTANKTWNDQIKECYLPNFTEKYGAGYKLRNLRCVKEGISFHIYKNDATTVIETCGKDVTEGYYKSNAITPLYENDSKELIGWVMLNYTGRDFNQSSSTGHEFNEEIVEDISNSPTIAAMLASDEQIILTGDSLQGQPQENSLPDILRGLTGKQVWNIACGGCRMAWRTSDGSNFYDKFTFSDLMEAIANNDFSDQQSVLSVDDMPTNFRVQYANMLQIDGSKKTIVICNYMANDLTGDSEIGDYWNYIDVVSEYNRQTFLGAMNYGLNKVLTAYPLFKFVFIGNFFRYLAPNLSSDKTIPPYAWKNNLGKKAEDYMDAEVENCRRFGIKCYDTINWGLRNAYSMNEVTTDGTHFNAYGFHEFAKLLTSLLY